MKTPHEKYIQRCLDLALLGKGMVSPNPMVGSVIVHNDRIIGEGFHQKHGGPHAEVNAINSVQNKDLLTEATIYVSLEPCSHFGKTPPCTDLILKHRIPRVVIASLDPFALVCGNGVKKLKEAGVEVTIGIQEEQSKAINPYFFTYQEKKRPFVILKWAETEDGFIDHFRDEKNTRPVQISDSPTNRWVHQLRSGIDAILVGKNTALLDNPKLTTRKVAGKNPLRVVIDRKLELPPSLHLFTDSNPTLVINEIESKKNEHVEYFDAERISVPSILDVLYQYKIQSVMIEGGAETLKHFIASDLWDVAYRIKSSHKIFSGIEAPTIQSPSFKIIDSGKDKILVYEK